MQFITRSNATHDDSARLVSRECQTPYADSCEGSIALFESQRSSPSTSHRICDHTKTSYELQNAPHCNSLKSSDKRPKISSCATPFNTSFNSSSLNMVENSFPSAFLSVTQMFQNFGFQSTASGYDPFMDVSKPLPSTQPSVSTLCSTCASNEDLGFRSGSNDDVGLWSTSHCSDSSSKLSSTMWTPYEVLSLSDVDDTHATHQSHGGIQNTGLPSPYENSRLFPHMDTLHRNNQAESLNRICSSGACASPEPSMKSFPSYLNRPSKTWTNCEDQGVGVSDSRLINALFHYNKKGTRPALHSKTPDTPNAHEHCSTPLKVRNATTLSPCAPCSQYTMNRRSSTERTDALNAQTHFFWKRYNHAPVDAQKQEHLQCVGIEKKPTTEGYTTHASVVGHNTSSVSVNGKAYSIACSLDHGSQTSLLKGTRNGVGSRLVTENQEMYHARLDNARGSRKVERRTTRCSVLEGARVPTDMMVWVKKRYGAPQVLVHPEEFINPSSFLKVYGDPLCNSLSEEKRASLCIVSGENGNWSCHMCGNVNYPRRFRCNKCNELRDAQGDALVSEYVLEVYKQHLKLCRQFAQETHPKDSKNEVPLRDQPSVWMPTHHG